MNRPLRGTRLVPAALRAPAQLTPSHSSALVSAAMSHAREGSPAALCSACSCNLCDREDRKEQQCGQERRGGSHCLLVLPLHVRLLQGRAFGHLRVLEEGARGMCAVRWCSRWSLVRGAGRVLCRRGPPQQRTTEQHAAQKHSALHFGADQLALVEQPSRPAPKGERQQVQAGAQWAGGATSARRCPCARARHRRLDASAKSSDLVGVGELVREVQRDSTGELAAEEQGEASVK